MQLSAWDNDWQFMDGVKTGTIKPRNPVTLADITGVKYRDSKLSFAMQQMVAQGLLQGRTKAITVWKATAGGYVMAEQDQFVDADGNRWVVKMGNASPVGGDNYLLNLIQ